MPRALTEAETAQRMGCLTKGMSLVQAAGICRVTTTALRCWAFEHGNGLRFPAPSYRTLPEQGVRDAAERGLTLAQAAADLGCTYEGLQRYASKRGIVFTRERQPKAAKPAAAPSPRLTTSLILLPQMTEAERADFLILRKKGGYSVPQALQSIRRPDLLAQLHATVAA